MAEIHTPDEHIAVADLDAMVEVTLALVDAAAAASWREYGSAAVRIGVAKEIKSDEYRVALTPAGALELINGGHEVAIETGAGAGSAFADESYERVGARIVSVDDVWGASELLLKVKEPIASRVRRLREG